MTVEAPTEDHWTPDAPDIIETRKGLVKDMTVEGSGLRKEVRDFQAQARKCKSKATLLALGKSFKDDLKEYTEWIDSLCSEAIYKSLIDANAAADLADI